MARRKKSNQNRILFGFLIVVGLVVIAIPVLDFEFDVLPLALLRESFGCDPNSVGFGEVSFGRSDCFLSFNSFTTDQLPFQHFLGLSIVDKNSPIILEYNFIPNPQNATNCDPFVTDVVTLRVTDENGNLVVNAMETAINLQPLLLPDQQTLIINFASSGIGVCPTENVQYSRTGTNGIRFLPAPPEIQEVANPLLEQWLFLANFRDTEFIETSNHFAVAEEFQLTQPTVITGLRVRVGSGLSLSLQDAGTSLTAYVWNTDKVPPERVVQSAETFDGIRSSRVELDLDFTFPNAVALLPNNNYAVGIKVKQETGQEFAYTHSDQTANTHRCVIDKSPQPNGETLFVDNGICGFDIFHSQFNAFTILNAGQTGGGGNGGGTTIITQTEIIEKITNIENTILTLGSSSEDQITKTELIAILCEGIEPRPQVCEEGTGIFLTANQCGVTEIFFEGDCLCQPGFDRTEQGTCELRDDRPSILQVGQFASDDLILIGLGLLIIVVGAVGIAFVRGRRR